MSGSVQIPYASSVASAVASEDGARVRVRIRGMRCASCARTIECLLPRTPGVDSVLVNFAAESAMIRWNPGIVRFDAIAAAAASAGFELVPDEAWASGRSSTRGREEARAGRDTILRLAVGVFFSMNAMAPALAIYAGLVDGMSHATAWRLALASGAFAVPVLAYSGWPFFVGAWRNLRSGSLGMDFLVAAGAALAFVYSAERLARGSSEVYFDSASMIITLLLVGRAIEKRARQRGGDAVRDLLATAPETVRVLDEDGIEHERAASAVVVGDLVRVRPGERAAVDGIVTAGASSLDRSLLTGESAAVAIGVGGSVEAGTVNGEGALTLRVTAATGDRAIDGIARAVEGLLSKRAPLAALSDRAVRLFVPSVVVLATGVGVAHGIGAGSVGAGLLRAVSVLVIACPCALGLATPMAILVAAGSAARRGILFRDGDAIERAAQIDVALFDKTGTLTEGRPRVVGVQAAPDASDEEVLAVAAEAEAQSEHPIARAILSAAPPAPRGRPGGVLVAHPGLGVTWTTDEATTLIGNERLLREHSIAAPPVMADAGTRVEVARNGCWRGRIFVSDTLRPTTPRALDALRATGISVGIISGDARAPVLEIGRALGIAEDDLESECTPTQKANSIQKRRAGHSVAFVGDGLNDAVALCASDLAVAATGATDLAMQVAHVALREGGIARLPEALVLARRTRRVMRQNIAWAIGYNVVALPLAVAGFAPPIAAALAMALSSITVVANSLRLRGAVAFD